MNALKTKILLVGNGRVARHLSYDWAEALPGTTLLRWARASLHSSSSELQDLEHKIQQADVIALAISDSALQSFMDQHHGKNPAALWIHFSGALEIRGAQSFHPLMSFASELYDKNVYRRMSYVTATIDGSGQKQAWPQVLPLPNSLYSIRPEQKPLYHALCVLSGNFSNLLWAKAQSEFCKIGLDPEILQAYGEVCLRNVFKNPAGAITGPIARGDLHTQNKNLEALAQDPFQHIYRAFQKAFSSEA